jgi:integrase
MGTIVARRRKSGGTAYMAKIILKSSRQVIYRESKTFDSHRAAKDWLRHREADLSRSPPEAGTTTLAEAIGRYMRESRREIGKTKAQVLRAITRHRIASLPCEEVTTTRLVEFATELQASRSASTVGNYLSHLSAVFAVAKPAWGYPLDRAQIADAATVCRKLGLVSKSRERDRRPTRDEIDRLLAHFAQRDPRAMPMGKVIVFALFSTRRQEEITRIRWDDLDGHRVLVRDMKNPGQKAGNDVWCDLPPEARAVIDQMPRRAPEIFPFTTDAISAGFTRACRILGIDDLRFHDLRHEGISRLFEMGWTIPHVAAVSGHRSWQSLKRYTHLQQRGDKWAGWKG